VKTPELREATSEAKGQTRSARKRDPRQEVNGSLVLWGRFLPGAGLMAIMLPVVIVIGHPTEFQRTAFAAFCGLEIALIFSGLPGMSLDVRTKWLTVSPPAAVFVIVTYLIAPTDVRNSVASLLGVFGHGSPPATGAVRSSP